MSPLGFWRIVLRSPGRPWTKYSGRFKGMKGGSKFDCKLMGDRFACDVEGTIELP